MGRENVLFKSEEKKSSKEAADLLRIIADKIESGSISLSTGADSILMTIPNQVTFEIKAEEETSRSGRVKRSLEMELEWDADQEGKAGPEGLSIS